MEPTHPRTHLIHTILVSVLSLAILAAAAYGGYRYYLLDQAYQQLSLESSQKVASLQGDLAQAEATTTSLGQQLEGAQAVNNSFATQIGSISSTVGTLTKLSQTDPELLDKYSKVFFLSDNYVPASLTNIDPQYVAGTSNTLQFESDAYPFLKDMLDAAAQSGVDLKVVSAYRSFGTQAALKSAYKVTYGTGANAFSADQGYSEHQLGTAVDFTTSKLGANFDSFASTTAYTWLKANAYRYGFILSYPMGNTYYEFEPWHWRFVGIKLATDLRSEGKNFYDLDQRTLDSYLVDIFN